MVGAGLAPLGCTADGGGLLDADVVAATGPADAGEDPDQAGAAGSHDAANQDPSEAGDLPFPGDADPDAPAEPGDPAPWPPAIDPSLEREAPRGEAGPPEEVGCADGTREGFADRGRWSAIAGCAGGFRVPGLAGTRSYLPQCEREAGNTGANPAGVGCSVADLCAEGWQVCDDVAAVARRAPSGCEEAIPEGFALFFLIRAGTSASGLCVPNSGWQNDLLGCGSIGARAHESCAPLDRRLSFATCLGTAGIWSCGDVDSHLQETAQVSKAGPAFGGVLCCRDKLPAR